MKFCDEKIQRHLLSGGKIKRPNVAFAVFLNGCLCFKNGNGEIKIHVMSTEDLTAYDWEIAEPEYDWDKIIKDKVLCVFSNYEDFRYFNISTLIHINSIDEITYRSNGELFYKYCKPFNPAEFNIAKDLKEYEK